MISYSLPTTLCDVRLICMPEIIGKMTTRITSITAGRTR